MFNLLKKKYSIISPIDGNIIKLENVPDAVFACKMAGEGVAIDSYGSIVVAPVDGTITLIFAKNYAFAITLSSGIEILIHIGINTVELQGEGFEVLAKVGDFVKAGTPIIKLNRSLILSKGHSLIVPVLITNVHSTKDLNLKEIGYVRAGKNEIMNFKLI